FSPIKAIIRRTCEAIVSAVTSLFSLSKISSVGLITPAPFRFHPHTQKCYWTSPALALARAWPPGTSSADYRFRYTNSPSLAQFDEIPRHPDSAIYNRKAPTLHLLQTHPNSPNSRSFRSLHRFRLTPQFPARSYARARRDCCTCQRRARSLPRL